MHGITVTVIWLKCHCAGNDLHMVKTFLTALRLEVVQISGSSDADGVRPPSPSLAANCRQPRGLLVRLLKRVCRSSLCCIPYSLYAAIKRRNHDSKDTWFACHLPVAPTPSYGKIYACMPRTFKSVYVVSLGATFWQKMLPLRTEWPMYKDK
jgi:hypothetical protein